MDEQVKQILMAIGALSEMWTVTYKSFIGQGFKHKDALEHTSAFMKVFMASVIGQKEE